MHAAEPLAGVVKRLLAMTAKIGARLLDAGHRRTACANAIGPKETVMTIRIGDDNSYVAFDLVDRSADDQPIAGEIKLDVTACIRCGWGACTARYQLWFEKEVVEAFIADLKSLDGSNNGRAVVASMSPDEFSMELSASGKPEHTDVRLTIRQPAVASEAESMNLSATLRTLHRDQLRMLASGLQDFLDFGVDLA